MKLSKQYDVFHNRSKKQKRVIDSNNFTYRKIIHNINSSINKKNKLLDYGCGVGTLTYYFSRIFKESTGVDVSEKAISIAKESVSDVDQSKSTIKFLTVKNFKIKANKNKYDLIICSEVIEHVSNDRELIKKIFMYLKKGGMLFLSTPSSQAPLFRMGLLKKFDARVGHLRRYSQINLVNLIESEKFQIKKIIKTEGLLRNSLYTMKPLGFIVRFIKGPLIKIITVVDDYLAYVFGESDIQIIAQKP
ncbi:MAG: class I SAM-dependent methyltransferase [Patescibacteria group bacterium]